MQYRQNRFDPSLFRISQLIWPGCDVFQSNMWPTFYNTRKSAHTDRVKVTFGQIVAASVFKQY